MFDEKSPANLWFATGELLVRLLNQQLDEAREASRLTSRLAKFHWFKPAICGHSKSDFGNLNQILEQRKCRPSYCPSANRSVTEPFDGSFCSNKTVYANFCGIICWRNRSSFIRLSEKSSTNVFNEISKKSSIDLARPTVVTHCCELRESLKIPTIQNDEIAFLFVCPI